VNIRTLIVDDMKLARVRLRLALAQDSEIEIVGECANGREAVAAIRELRPELVFLDIQMPKMNGFDVIEAVGAKQMPVTVFATAFDEFALQAFEANALDYLLKPIDEMRLAKTVERVKRRILEAGPGRLDERLLRLLGNMQNKAGYLKRIPVKTAQHTVLVLIEDIDWIGAAGNYLELHAGKDIYLLRERISGLEQKLDPAHFIRIHRSTIVNLDHVRTIHPMFNGDQTVVLHDETKLNLSRTYSEKFLARLSG
jgi:two-component system LytT family response regulator